MQTSPRFYQYLAAIGVNLGILSLGMHYGWCSTSLNILTSGNHTFTINNDDASWLASILPIGSVVGDILAALTINSLGKKFIITTTVFPIIFSWVLIALAKNVSNVLMARFIAGLSDGLIFTTAPAFLAEISDPEIRGFLGGTYVVSLVGGMLSINVIQYYLPMGASAWIAACVSLSMVMILPFIPESAYHHLMKCHENDAKSSLRKFTGKTEVDDELKRISTCVDKDFANGTRYYELMLKPTNKKALILSCTLYVLSQLIGIDAVLTFGTTIFENSKNFMSPEISNILYFSVLFIVSFVSSVFVDVSGRKLLLIISSLGSAITLFGTGLYLYCKEKNNIGLEHVEYIEIIMLVAYIISFSIGLQTIPTIMCSELFSSRFKNTGICISNITYSLSTTLCLKLFTWGSDNYGMHLPFFFYSAMAVVMIIFVVAFVPETKGKTLEGIQKKLEVERKSQEKIEYFIENDKSFDIAVIDYL